MELRQYVTIIWKWLRLIVLGTVLAGGTAFLVSRNTTPIYRASAMLFINEAPGFASTTTAPPWAGSSAPMLMSNG